MTTLAEIGTGGCLQAFANGSVGQVLTIGASGEPAWLASDGDDQAATEVAATATLPFTGNTVQALLDAISPHARRTYSNDQSATLLNNVAPTSPVSPPAGAIANEVMIEYYGDAVATWEYNGAAWVLRGIRYDCCISAPVTIPAAAFATANAPTVAEVQTWLAANLPNARRGQLLIYPLNGTTDDPNYVWSVDGDGTVTNLENATFFDSNEIEGAGTQASPFGTRFIGASLNTSAVVATAGTWVNIGLTTVAYDTDAMAVTGAASGFTMPINGVYHFDVYVHFLADFQGAVPAASGYQVAIGLWIDGVFTKRMDDYYSDIQRPAGSTNIAISLSGSCDHTVFAGSFCEIRMLVFTGNGNCTLDGGAVSNWFNVHRVH